jgi:hypothetical protein
MGTEDYLHQALARLRAIRDNIPGYPPTHVSERIVEEYHEALTYLSRLGYEIEQYTIPSKDVGPRIVYWTPSGPGRKSQPVYSADRWVPREIFFMKIDAVISYFELRQRSTTEEIRFGGPRRREFDRGEGGST